MNKNVFSLPDGKGFSPDGGKGEVRENIIYWEDGGITDLSVGGLAVRWMPEGGFPPTHVHVVAPLFGTHGPLHGCIVCGEPIA
jgi:hypothetical protein